MGSLSVSSYFVTMGALHGYGYTFIGEKSNLETCVVPACAEFCAPAFSGTALCAAGVVAADLSYNSTAGVGFKLNQTSAGVLTTIPAPATLTVGVRFFDSDDRMNGNWHARVQVRDQAGSWYCVESGYWASGEPIDITLFNTNCWNASYGTSLTVGVPIVELDVIVTADSTLDRPFSFCITDAAFD
jgi:hypothetical protein